MLHAQLQGRRIAITGARGFVGSALAARLRGYGCDLELVTRQPVSQTATAPGPHWSTRDLTTVEAWSDLLSRNEIIFHLSAQSDLYRAEQFPRESEIANVVPIEWLVEAARMSSRPAPTIIMASTATIVGMNENIPVDDLTPDRPITVYDKCKKRCEELLSETANAGSLSACSLRLANVFGFGVRSNNKNRGFLNAMIERAAAGQPITLYGKGEHIRDFVHIDDVVSAFCCAATAGSGLDGAHYLVASGIGHTLRQAMSIACEEASRLFGHTTPIVEIPVPVTLHEIERRNFVGNSARFSSLTGWRCHVDLSTGVRSFMHHIGHSGARPKG